VSFAVLSRNEPRDPVSRERDPSSTDNRTATIRAPSNDGSPGPFAVRESGDSRSSPPRTRFIDTAHATIRNHVRNEDEVPAERFFHPYRWARGRARPVFAREDRTYIRPRRQ